MYSSRNSLLVKGSSALVWSPRFVTIDEQCIQLTTACGMHISKTCRMMLLLHNTIHL